MSKQPTTTVDYKVLFLQRIKENQLPFSLGLATVTLLLISGFFFIWSQVSSKSKAVKDSEPKVASVNKQVKTYTIQEGDQLWLVSQKLYGSGFNMEDIMKANNISNPDLIEVGQKLIIPDVKPRFPTTGEISSGIATSNKQQGTSNQQQTTYIVKEGDDLAKIALQVYGDSYAWPKIAEANKLVNPNLLTAGMVLTIPR